MLQLEFCTTVMHYTKTVQHVNSIEAQLQRHFCPLSATPHVHTVCGSPKLCCSVLHSSELFAGSIGCTPLQPPVSWMKLVETSHMLQSPTPLLLQVKPPHHKHCSLASRCHHKPTAPPSLAMLTAAAGAVQVECPNNNH